MACFDENLASVLRAFLSGIDRPCTLKLQLCSHDNFVSGPHAQVDNGTHALAEVCWHVCIIPKKGCP